MMLVWDRNYLTFTQKKSSIMTVAPGRAFLKRSIRLYAGFYHISQKRTRRSKKSDVADTAPGDTFNASGDCRLTPDRRVSWFV